MIHLHKALQILLAVLVILCAAAAHTAPLRVVTATITKITDGDTVQAVTPEGTKLKVRLHGIDAPETPKGKIPGEPFGNDSLNYLAALVTQKFVRGEIRDIDRYRRIKSGTTFQMFDCRSNNAGDGSSSEGHGVCHGPGACQGRADPLDLSSRR